MSGHDIDIEMNVDSSGETYGLVTIDGWIRFPFTRRTYIDKETGEKEAFIAFPRRERNGKWEDAVSLDKELKEEVKQKIWDKQYERWSNIYLPEVEVVSLTPVSYNTPPGIKAQICGYATVKLCGVTIQGISIKKGEKGLFVNMPQYKNGKGEYKDMAYPTSKDLREAISKEVIERYREAQKSLQNGSPKPEQERSIKL